MSKKQSKQTVGGLKFDEIARYARALNAQRQEAGSPSRFEDLERRSGELLLTVEDKDWLKKMRIVAEGF